MTRINKGNPKGRMDYKPEGCTIVSILFGQGWESCKQIGEALEVSPSTILNWDRANKFPCWAMERLGFVVKFGDTEIQDDIKEELEALRDKLNQILQGEE